MSVLDSVWLYRESTAFSGLVSSVASETFYMYESIYRERDSATFRVADAETTGNGMDLHLKVYLHGNRARALADHKKAHFLARQGIPGEMPVGFGVNLVPYSMAGSFYLYFWSPDQELLRHVLRQRRPGIDRSRISRQLRSDFDVFISSGVLPDSGWTNHIYIRPGHRDSARWNGVVLKRFRPAKRKQLLKAAADEGIRNGIFEDVRSARHFISDLTP